MVNKKQCNKCKNLISFSNFKRHFDKCIIDKKVRIKININWKLENQKYACPFCKKEFSKMGIGNHIWRSHGNGINFCSIKKGSIGWNKGLTKESDKRINNNAKSISNTCKQKIKNGWIPAHILWTKSDKGRKYQSEKRSNYLQNNSSQCKWFEYNNGKRNIKVQGTWEKIFVEYLIKNNIKWDRVKIFYDKVRTYTPDFYLPDYNIYIEVKGWMRERDILKMTKVYNEHLIDLRLVDNKNLIKKLKFDNININNLVKFIDKYQDV